MMYSVDRTGRPYSAFLLLCNTFRALLDPLVPAVVSHGTSPSNAAGIFSREAC
jgi:hypothetical protein